MNEEIKKMSEKQLEEQLSYLKKRLLTLEWDKSQNQLNIGMESILEKTRKELGETRQRISEIRQASAPKTEVSEELAKTETAEKLEQETPQETPSIMP